MVSVLELRSEAHFTLRVCLLWQRVNDCTLDLEKAWSPQSTTPADPKAALSPMV